MKKAIPKEVFIFSVFAVLCYQSGYLFPFFLVPLQILKNKKGFYCFFKASIITLATIVVVAFVRTKAITGADRLLIIATEMYMPTLLLAGFLYINCNWVGNPRMLKKVLIASAGAFIAFFPGILIYNSEFMQSMYRSQVAFALEILKNTFSQSVDIYSASMLSVIETLEVETIYENMKKLVLRGAVFLYFMTISINWWMGSFGIKNGKWQSAFSPSKFVVQEVLIWPLIIALLTVIFDFKISLGFIGYLGWNILLIMGVIYGFKGFGIIQALMVAVKMPATFRIFFTVTLVLMLMQPGLNYGVLIGLPALGVSEIWVKYKRS